MATEKLGPGWVHFHLLIWKHLITQLTKISTENAKLSIPDIWKLAWRDFAAKVEAKAEGLRERLRAAYERPRAADGNRQTFLAAPS